MLRCFLRIDGLEQHFSCSGLVQSSACNAWRLQRRSRSERTDALFASTAIRCENDERVAGHPRRRYRTDRQWRVSLDQRKRISGFCSALPKQSQPLASNILPASSWPPAATLRTGTYVVIVACIANNVLFRRRWIALCGQAVDRGKTRT